MVMRIQCPCCRKEYRFSGSEVPRNFSCQRCGNVIPATGDDAKTMRRTPRPSGKTIALWLGICVLMAVPIGAFVMLRSESPDEVEELATPERPVDVTSKDSGTDATDATEAKPDAKKRPADTLVELKEEVPVSPPSDSDSRRQRLVERLEKGVLLLKVDCGDHGNLGSGFLAEIAGRRVVLTNFHVVEGARRIIAEFHDGRLGNVRGFYHAAPEMDLCVLDVQIPSGDREMLPLLRTEPAKAAEVLALGSPKGLGFSVTLGIVSGLRSKDELRGLGRESDDGSPRRLWSSASARWVQTSAPISSGNSGGPLVDMSGQVVGINTFNIQALDAQNLNFALSSVSVLEEVKNISGESRSFDELPRQVRQKK